MSAAGRSASAETGHVRHADDFYSTPAWCTHAILPHLAKGPILEPCAGSGGIIDVVRRVWPDVAHWGYELDADRARRASVRCVDALAIPWAEPATIITNPPFVTAMDFVARAVNMGCASAFLLRLNWLSSQKRASFHRTHPADVYVLPRRPSFTDNGKTDSTEYAWFVWGPGRGGRWQILDCDI